MAHPQMKARDSESTDGPLPGREGFAVISGFFREKGRLS
jgi:hypothetical protein